METIASQESALVLVIDDDPFARLQLRLWLQGEGYQIIEAKDGSEGLIAYCQFQPDIVLLDALMPGIDGFECCTQLQELPREHQIPILMITGLDDQTSVDRAFEVGAADYVTKPVHWPVLRQRVRRLIRQAELQRQLEVANRELRRLAMVDGLTQVANRRQFDELLHQEWQQHLQKQQPLSLALCDIDCFKLYNDTYGHQAGDRCLQQVAKAIQAAVDGLVARYGGEEFALLLLNQPAEIALTRMQQVYTNLKLLAIPHINSVESYITVSMGLASAVPTPDLQPEALITAADRALYRAKHEGRNRCCVDDRPLDLTHHDVPAQFPAVVPKSEIQCC